MHQIISVGLYTLLQFIPKQFVNINTPGLYVTAKGLSKVSFLSATLPTICNYLSNTGWKGSKFVTYGTTSVVKLIESEIQLILNGKFFFRKKQTQKLIKTTCEITCKATFPQIVSPLVTGKVAKHVSKVVCSSGCNAIDNYFYSKNMSFSDLVYKYITDIVAVSVREALIYKQFIDVAHFTSVGVSAVSASLKSYILPSNADKMEKIIEETCSNEAINALGGETGINNLHTELSASQGWWNWVPYFGKDASIRKSYNKAIDNAWHKHFVDKDGQQITAKNAELASDVRTCVKAISQKYTSDPGTLWIYSRNYLKYGKLFPTYQDCKDKGRSDKRCFYSAFKTDGGDIRLEGNNIGHYIRQWEYLIQNGVSEDISVTDIINIKDILNDFAQINDLRLADLIVNNQEQFKNLFENTEFYDSKSGNELIELLDVVIKKRLINAVNGFQSDYEIAHNCQCTVVNVCAVDRKYTTNYSDLDKSDQVRGGIDYPESCYDELDSDPEILAVKTVCEVGGDESVIFKNFNQFEIGAQSLQLLDSVDCGNYL